jgi:hypothetical protein
LVRSWEISLGNRALMPIREYPPAVHLRTASGGGMTPSAFPAQERTLGQGSSRRPRGGARTSGGVHRGDAAAVPGLRGVAVGRHPPGPSSAPAAPPSARVRRDSCGRSTCAGDRVAPIGSARVCAVRLPAPRLVRPAGLFRPRREAWIPVHLSHVGQWRVLRADDKAGHGVRLN